MRASSHTRPAPPWAPAAAAAFGLLVLVSMLRWAGLPRVDLALFVVGAASVIGMLVGIALLGWHLLLRPAAGVRTSAPILGVVGRRRIAGVLASSGLLIAVGGYWDEVWHRTYGLAFGQDLFWRPHLLMYAGFLAVIALAAVSALLLWRRGRGGLRERFRSDPTLGSLVLLGAFLLYALPADPAWHTVYGADITAWSLPHLVLLVIISAIMLGAATLHLGTLPRRDWHGVRGLRADIALAIVAVASASMLSTQILTTEWEGITRLRLGSLHPFWQRPEWLLPVVVVATAAFFGTFALRATRFVGAATLVGLVALGLRALLVQVFESPQMTVHPWLLALPPLLALDLVHGGLRALRGRVPGALASGLAATAGLAAGTLPLIASLYLYPRIGVETVPVMLAIALVSALWAAYLGASLGERCAPVGAEAAVREPRVGAPATAAALLGALAFTVWFIATATPPA
jgi:hypothetical protein